MNDYMQEVVYWIATKTELTYHDATVLINSYDIEHYEQFYYAEELAELIVIDWQNNTNEILASLKG